MKCPCKPSCDGESKTGHYAQGHDMKVAARHRKPGESPSKAQSRLKAEYGTMSKAQEALEVQ